MEAGRCPGCFTPYGRKQTRRITEECGHERCVRCSALDEECPVCTQESSADELVDPGLGANEYASTCIEMEQCASECMAAVNVKEESEEVGDSRSSAPASETEDIHDTIIKTNGPWLLRKMHLGDWAVLSMLEEKGVVGKTDIQRIMNGETDVDKNQKLMDHLRRRPYSEFQMFLKILNETNQAHVVKGLKGLPKELLLCLVNNAAATPQEEESLVAKLDIATNEVKVSRTTQWRSVQTKEPALHISICVDTIESQRSTVQKTIYDEICHDLEQANDTQIPCKKGAVAMLLGIDLKENHSAPKDLRQVCVRNEVHIELFVYGGTTRDHQALWDMYESHQLDHLFTQDYIKDDLKKRLGIKRLGLQVKINEGQYKACTQHIIRKGCPVTLKVVSKETKRLQALEEEARLKKEIAKNMVETALYEKAKKAIDGNKMKYAREALQMRNDYFQGGRIVQNIKRKSIVIVVECTSTEDMEDMYDKCLSGLLGEEFLRQYADQDLIDRFNEEGFILKAQIDENDYIQYKEHLMGKMKECNAYGMETDGDDKEQTAEPNMFKRKVIQTKDYCLLYSSMPPISTACTPEISVLPEDTQVDKNWSIARKMLHPILPVVDSCCYKLTAVNKLLFGDRKMETIPYECIKGILESHCRTRCFDSELDVFYTVCDWLEENKYKGARVLLDLIHFDEIHERRLWQVLEEAIMAREDLKSIRLKILLTLSQVLDTPCPMTGPGVYIMSGTVSNAPLTTVWASSGVYEFEFRPLASVPEPKYAAACTQMGGLLYVAGGMDRHHIVTATVWKFNPNFATWKPIPDMIQQRKQFTLTAMWPWLIAVGGQDASGQNVCSSESIDMNINIKTALSSWQKSNTPNLPKGISCHAASEYNGWLYITGGFTEDGITRTTYQWRRGNKKWTRCEDMLDARAHHSMASGDSMIFVAGGCMSPVSVEMYIPATNQWSALADMPGPKEHSAACYISDSLFVLGYGPEIYEYHPGENTWVTAEGELPWGIVWDACVGTVMDSAVCIKMNQTPVSSRHRRQAHKEDKMLKGDIRGYHFKRWRQQEDSQDSMSTCSGDSGVSSSCTSTN